MSGLQASQNTEKLVIIPRNWYIQADFGGVEWPPLKLLSTDNSSDSIRDTGALNELSRIASRFGGATRAMGGSLLTATMLAGPALAQQAPVQKVATSIPQVQILPDAHSSADEWVAGNRDRIAVSVRLGTRNAEAMKSEVPLIIGYQLSERDETNVRYFWEQGVTENTGIALHSDAYVTEPLTFTDPQELISEMDKLVRLKNAKPQDFASGSFPRTAYD